MVERHMSKHTLRRVNLQCTLAKQTTRIVGWVAGTLVVYWHWQKPKSQPKARDARDRAVECCLQQTGCPVRSNRKEHMFYPSLSSTRSITGRTVLSRI
jgi:hypothetical protein